MATDNDTLRDQLRQTEKDTLDVVSFLKKQDQDKDVEVKRLNNKSMNKSMNLKIF